MGEYVYHVYLVPSGDRAGGQREITSPVEGTDVEFYDSGVWLTRETGRNYFPYEQVRTIREHPEGEAVPTSGVEAEPEMREDIVTDDTEAEAETDGGSEASAKRPKSEPPGTHVSEAGTTGDRVVER